ncbi:MAG TPA: SIS domain-containing protein [Rhodanobacteraceae bacterium]|nr:SIS domain-containing protein [Rhodanobacteraceae bacterium]
MNILSIFDEHNAVMRDVARLAPLLEQAVAVMQACLASGQKILVCGNGGSAASAQHFVAELVCRFRDDRRAMAAIALTSDTMTLTAIGNDYGYDRIFARQIEAIAQPGDVLLAVSTSGNSPNILAAAQTAGSMRCKVIALTGGDGGALASLADLSLKAPSRVVARIQEVHDIWIHVLAQALETHAAR